MSWKFSDCVFDIPIENEWEAAPIKFSPTLLLIRFFMFSVIFILLSHRYHLFAKTPSSPINGPMSWEFSDCVFGFPIENEWEAAPIKFSPTLFFSQFFSS